MKLDNLIIYTRTLNTLNAGPRGDGVDSVETIEDLHNLLKKKKWLLFCWKGLGRKSIYDLKDGLLEYEKDQGGILPDGLIELFDDSRNSRLKSRAKRLDVCDKNVEPPQ